ncbi:MAG: GT4 family glycosyltransferase PelF [Elusimicrobia bacterium]|nr:GT4 family glycosyltransferase PelF [Elusimicrobiota bacterium]
MSAPRKRICLVLEGTYPYVKGGVSVWAHELIAGSPENDYVILALTDRPRGPKDLQFDLPKNVVEVVTINLNEPRPARGWLTRFQGMGSAKPVARAFADALEGLQRSDFSGLEPLVRGISASKLDENALLNNAVFWDVISRLYAMSGQDDSIARFYWVWESMARGAVRLIRSDLPKADLYHAAATGYSGLVGCLAKLRYGKPLIVSEHGLYLQERQMEVAFHEFLQGGQRKAVETFFEWISRWVYREADAVTSLAEFIRRHQMEHGASAATAHVIPNGIDIGRFTRAAHRQHKGFRIGLVGRVAPVKDIKLLVLAAAELRNFIPDLRVAVIGSVEDPVYERECRALVSSRGLDSIVKFEGVKAPTACYGDLDLLVLCSLKEVQPLTVLEAMAAGVPMVATRSGGIPDMLSGIGQVVPPRDLTRLVRAIRRVYEDKALRERMIEAGRERVKSYDVATTLARFNDLYNRLTEAAWPASV